MRAAPSEDTRKYSAPTQTTLHHTSSPGSSKKHRALPWSLVSLFNFDSLLLHAALSTCVLFPTFGSLQFWKTPAKLCFKPLETCGSESAALLCSVFFCVAPNASVSVCFLCTSLRLTGFCSGMSFFFYNLSPLSSRVCFPVSKAGGQLQLSIHL